MSGPLVDRRGRSSDRRTSDVLHRPHRRGSDPDLFRKSESAHLLRAGSPGGGGRPGPSPAAADPVSPARGAAGASWFAAHGLRSPPSLSPRLQQLHFNSRQACPNHTEPLGGGEAQIKHTVADERSAVVNANLRALAGRTSSRTNGEVAGCGRRRTARRTHPPASQRGQPKSSLVVSLYLSCLEVP